MSRKKTHQNIKISGKAPSAGKSPAYAKAVQLYQAGKLQEAEPIFLAHLVRYPKDAQAANLAGLIAYRQRRFDDAIGLFKSAIESDDTGHSFFNNLGAALKENGKPRDAIPYFQKAVAIKADYCEASYNLGGAYQFLGELDLAIEWYEYTLDRNPEYHLAHGNRACVYKDQGKIEQAIEDFRQVLIRNPDDAMANSNLVFCLNYLEDIDPNTIFLQHQEWAKRHAPQNPVLPESFSNLPVPNRRIRVGYVSADFRTHSVAFFMFPILQARNREQIEVTCYADVPRPDEVTQILMANSDHWQSITGMTDDQVFLMIQNDQIDILVDLAGHSGNNRMRLFARKPAPIQVSYLGYPNTTGLPSVDYRLTDAVTDPPNVTDRYYTEKLVRIDGGFLCYQPSNNTPDIGDAPCLTHGYITFGSFNNRAKINSRVIALWSNLLKQVEGSRLLLKSSIASDEAARQQLLSLFVQNGIEAARIEILPLLTFNEHLNQYSRVDIALDTFPYNGTTTTCEALWMGVPVITKMGNTHASRVGASILGQLDLDECVAATESDYIQKAVRLADNKAFLQSWRNTGRNRMQKSSLMDKASFVKKIEAAYRQMWLEWCAGRIEEGHVNADVMIIEMTEDLSVCVSGSIRDPSSDMMHLCPDWFEQETAFIRAFLKPGMTAVDIGANYGAYTLTAARSVGPSGKIRAYESDPVMAACLSRSLHLNRLDNVKLVRSSALDDELITWEKNPDFLRINTIAQESPGIEAAKRILENGAPLLLFETGQDDAFDPEMVRSFLTMGYQRCRLIPGLGILAPHPMTNMTTGMNPNLFFFKSGFSKMLVIQDLLALRQHDAFSASDISPETWIDHLQNFPYMLRCLPLWQAYCQEHVHDPGWQTHQNALNAFSVSRLPGCNASERYTALTRGYDMMTRLLARDATISRILSAARMAMDLGYRDDVLQMVNHLLKLLGTAQTIFWNEPFVAISPNMAAIDPQKDVGQWLVYAMLETRVNCHLNSWNPGLKSAVMADFELMKTLPFYNDDMERKRNFLSGEIGQQPVNKGHESLENRPDAAFRINNDDAKPDKSIKKQIKKPKKTEANPLQQQMTEAVQYHKAGRFHEAVAIYDQVLAKHPNHSDALHLSGVVAHQTGQHQKAVQLIRQAIHLSPKTAIYHYNLGAAFNALEQYEDAVQSYQKALSLQPDYADVYSNQGNTLKSLGKIDEAITSLKEAIRLKPDFADAYNNLGSVYNHLRRYDDAFACFQKALELNPGCVECLSNIGNVHKDQNRLSEAVLWYQKALTHRAVNPEVYNNLGYVLYSQGKVRDAIAFLETAIHQKPQYAAVHSNLLFGLNYLADEGPDAIFERHRNWDIRHGAGVLKPITNWPSIRNPDKRIHIGYLSPDFRKHSVAFFIEPILKAHNPDKFQVICYSNTPHPDEVTGRIKALGWEWRDIFGQNDSKVIDLILADNVQILVDLAGHTANNRLPVFARKPAPLQVTYLGYPNTTGLGAMDYRITDDKADPPGLTEHFHTEQLIRLSGSFVSYQPPDDTPEISDLPALKSNGITFASFNNRTKITTAVIHTWATILNQIPGARLILKSKALADPETRQELAKQFAACQAPPERLEMHGLLPYQSHLALYHRVDAALDTFPYNGTTTTCEALWMGVPVISMAGITHASRVGVSLLTSVGLDSFITGSVDDYIQKAVALSQNLPMLSSIRSGLRETMRNSPLMDAKCLTQSLEQAYETIWANFRNQHGTESDHPSKF